MKSGDFLALGNSLYESGDWDGAKLHFEAALAEDPQNAAALANLGVALTLMGLYETATVQIRRALAIDPTNAKWWCNLGNVLTLRYDFQGAKLALDNALRLNGRDLLSWHNAGLMYYRIGYYDSAIHAFSVARELSNGGTVGARCDLSHALLSREHTFDEGLEFFEARWEPGPTSIGPMLLPANRQWQGEDLGNKTILLWGEQGFGDILMLARIVPEFIKRAKYVTVAVPESMKMLFQAQGWNTVVWDESRDHWLDLFDFHSPLFSALRWLRKSERVAIKSVPYLHVPETQSSTEVDTLKVGICWASGRREGFGQRKVPLELLLPLAEISGVRLFSLQLDEADANDIHRLGAESLVVEPLRKGADWLQTASILGQLDMIVSVDTAVAHLSAALGKPTHMMSQFTRCWRWWNCERGSGLPWYNTMSIVRQETPDDWSTAVNRVIQNVKHVAGDRNAHGHTTSSRNSPDRHRFDGFWYRNAVAAYPRAETVNANGAY